MPRGAKLHVEYTAREVISSVMKHIKEAVKQPADIDLFRVNWRSRKADTLCFPIKSLSHKQTPMHIQMYSIL